jgi:CRISPR type IV-associated protein Csf3
MTAAAARRHERCLWVDDYRPLLVRAYLGSPIAMLPHDGMPLDGILEAAASKIGRRLLSGARLHANGRPLNRPRDGWPVVLQYRRETPTGTVWTGCLDDGKVNYVLPVKRSGHRGDPDWLWHCSWAVFPRGYELDRTHWNKRFDGGDAALDHYLTFGGRSERINPKAGRYRSYHQPLPLLIAPLVEWYCLGAADGLTLLLAQITHLGKKRGYGNGEVLRWELWPLREDWSLWRDGRPMRALPDGPWFASRDYRRGRYAIRAPYPDPTRVRDCVLPDDLPAAGTP